MCKITITEDNYESVLLRIRRTTETYKMIHIGRVFRGERLKEIKHAVEIPVSTKFIRDKNGKMIQRKLILIDSDMTAVEHASHIEYRRTRVTNGEYSKMHYLIRLLFGNKQMIDLKIGDEIRFIPNNAFIVYSKGDWRTSTILPVLYWNMFIPNKFNKRKAPKYSDMSSLRSIYKSNDDDNTLDCLEHDELLHESNNLGIIITDNPTSKLENYIDLMHRKGYDKWCIGWESLPKYIGHKIFNMTTGVIGIVTWDTGYPGIISDEGPIDFTAGEFRHGSGSWIYMIGKSIISNKKDHFRV